jgi:acyl-CoA synthetase (AMP-forming)/AMP-acid ligase II
MAIDQYASRWPGKAATVMAQTGQSISYGQLEGDSSRLAGALRKKLTVGNRVALLMENCAEYFTAVWAARRAGLRTVPVNVHLNADETSYILRNSNARALVTSTTLSNVASSSIDETELEIFISIDAQFGQFESLAEILRQHTPLPVDQSAQGTYMFYSSGTTGRPKGILRPLPTQPFGTLTSQEEVRRAQFGFDSTTIYLCPSPLYHAAPLAWSVGIQAVGGTVILMPRFDAELALESIERHRVTHAQFVPTHFVRLLRLPDDTRSKYDLSSLKSVVHTGAPCAPEVKREMISWFGPIIHDYYGSSEGAGVTTVDAATWLKKPGTVGKAIVGRAHILDDDGRESPCGVVGTIWFEGIDRVAYHDDAKATAALFNDRAWASVGDVGWLDQDGYLYLTDRKNHTIISGGVNIYPQEVENALVLHDAISDVAVIGVPNKEYGEEVKAVVQLATGVAASQSLKDEILSFCRARLAAYKCPRTVDFVSELPRLPNGKLLKRRLRDHYWPRTT